MKNLYTAQLRAPLQALIDSGSRINAAKKERYWYPLSVATYDVEEVLAAVDSLCSFRTTMWEKTAQFERHFSMLQGRGEAVMVNSGSSADLVAAFALVNPMIKKLRPGDEVLLPAVTWPTHIWSAMMAGLKVRLVDVSPETLNVDLEALEAAVSSESRGIFLVHLMGNPCDMEEVTRIAEEHSLVLVEDCCESLGAQFAGTPVGSFGVAATFSFFFSHHLTTMEGGMITCDDPEFSDVCRLLRAHGWSRNARNMATVEIEGMDPRYTFVNWGFNLRPTEIQSAFGLVQLERFPGFHRQRCENADSLCKELAKYRDLISMMEVPKAGECSWFALPVMVSPGAPFSRDELVLYLENAGIETRPIVAGSLARHPVSRIYPELHAGSLPGADAIHDRGFYIGIHPLPEGERIARVVDAFEVFLDRVG